MRLTEHEVVATVQTITLVQLRLWVDEGWLAPVRGDAGPSFDHVDIARIRLVCQLRDEMNLNEDSIPVVLSLMDQLYSVRRELRSLARAVDSQPTDIRDRIRAEYRAGPDRIGEG